MIVRDRYQAKAEFNLAALSLNRLAAKCMAEL
jgi:hypothetical protein